MWLRQEKYLIEEEDFKTVFQM